MPFYGHIVVLRPCLVKLIPGLFCSIFLWVQEAGFLLGRGGWGTCLVRQIHLYKQVCQQVENAVFLLLAHFPADNTYIGFLFHQGAPYSTRILTQSLTALSPSSSVRGDLCILKNTCSNSVSILNYSLSQEDFVSFFFHVEIRATSFAVKSGFSSGFSSSVFSLSLTFRFQQFHQLDAFGFFQFLNPPQCLKVHSA